HRRRRGRVTRARDGERHRAIAFADVIIPGAELHRVRRWIHKSQTSYGGESRSPDKCARAARFIDSENTASGTARATGVKISVWSKFKTAGVKAHRPDR